MPALDLGRADSLPRSPGAFGALLDLVTDPVLVVDAASRRILDAHDAACALLRHERSRLLALEADALGITLAPHVAGGERDGAEEGRLVLEASCRRGDGTTFAAEVSARRVCLDGRSAVLATLRDASAQGAAHERAAPEGDARFRALIDTLHVGVIVQGRRAEILLSNPMARELLGLTEDQLLGKTSFDPSWNVIREGGAPFPAGEQPVPRAIATRRPQRQIMMGVDRPAHRDRVWLLVDAEPHFDASGEVATVVCTFTDVTARREALAALRVSEARLREAQRIADVGSFERTRGSETFAWSDEMFRITGTDPAHFVATEEAILALHPPSERERVTALRERAVASNAPGYELEASIVRPDGEVRDLFLRGELLRDARGDVTSERGTVQNVTLRKRAERALVASEEQLRRAQKLEAVGRLAGGIAHDFNNLLSPILGFASLIHARLAEGDPLREPIETIQEAAESAAALIRQLLAFSRQQSVQPRSLDLNDVVARLDRILRPLLGERIDLALCLGAPLDRILADPSQIEQVILNLAVNARDAMPGGGNLRIETARTALPARGDDAPSGPHVRLSVIDTGTGIDDVTRSRLFEPFFTTKEPGKGTGLGLATVYAIVKQAGGDIRVESTVGQGARFDVYFPREDGPGAAEPRAPDPVVAPSRASEWILVVEDDALVRRTTSALLRDEGYRVLEASNAADALALLDSEPRVELLLSDVMMPGMSGLELVTEARARRPELKAVLLSGYSADVLSAGRASSAPVAFLSKPFRARELFSAVRAALEEAPPRRPGHA